MSLGYGRARLIDKIIVDNWAVKHPFEKKFSYNELLYVVQEMLDEEGKQYLEPGLPQRGHHIFRSFVKHLLYRNLANYDSMLLITSEKGCITDDSLIEIPRDLTKYPNGIPVKELIGKKNFYVYSFNIQTKKIELKKAGGCCFVKNDDVYEIELTNGQKLKATGDHPFLLIDGTYKQLKDLALSDNLRLFVRNIHSMIRIDYNKLGEKKRIPEHRFIAQQLLGCTDGKIVHHKNENHFDNNIENIQLLNTKEEHLQLHIDKMCKFGGYGKVIYKPYIRSIKYIGKKDVYDIYDVQDNHNFIANQFVVSNTGKSSAGIALCREWCRLIGIKFNVKRHIAFSNADVMNKIDLLNRFEPILCDESIRFASAVDWARRENRELKKKLAQIRTKHLLFVLCFPLKVYKLEKTYLESFCNYWCLSGDTKINIMDNKGMIRNVPISELRWKTGFKVLSYDIKNKIYEYKKCDKVIKTKKDAQVYEVELENGLKIKATDEHKFLTQRGYVKLKDLKSIDEIEIKTKECLYCKKSFIPCKEQMKFCCSNCNKRYHHPPEERKIYMKLYNEKNKERLKKQRKEIYLQNHEKYLYKARKYREINRDRINKNARVYRQNNIELLRKRDVDYRIKNYDRYIELSRKKYRKYMKYDINFKIAQNLRNGFRRVLKSQNAKKTKSVFKYIGCSIPFFKKYIEKQFDDWMTWDNWSPRTWHIDHIIPCKVFDLKLESERYKCFHYSNLQPLMWKDNLSKNDKVNY